MGYVLDLDSELCRLNHAHDDFIWENTGVGNLGTIVDAYTAISVFEFTGTWAARLYFRPSASGSWNNLQPALDTGYVIQRTSEEAVTELLERWANLAQSLPFRRRKTGCTYCQG